MNIEYNNRGLTTDEQKQLYINMLRPRLIEEKMLILLRQGRISKWFSGIGQEAIAVGATMALAQDEMIFPMHRNLGVFTTRSIPLYNLFCQWQGKAPGFTKGRDRSFHFGTKEYNVIGMISHLGPQLSLAAGVGLAHKLKSQTKLSLAFSGDGGTSQGEFHEAMNVSAVWNIPTIFLIENNGYGLSTPTSEQFVCEQLADRGKGYGMEAITINGNNIEEVYTTLRDLAEDIRKNPRPILVECMTFRRRGHEEASGTKYVPKDLMEHWEKLDPISNYEAYLIKQGVIDQDFIDEQSKLIKKEINDAVEQAFGEETITSTEDRELSDVYASSDSQPTRAIEQIEGPEVRFIDAIADGMQQAMHTHENLVLMGQDIAEYGGVFKVTDGLVAKYGKDRVRNTPLCESAIVGISMGLSLQGMKSMMEMQFADFVTCGFNQIVNNLAKVHYRWGHAADVVIRMPTGAGVGAGPFHSQSNEAWFTHTPGLKVVYPSNPYQAKGLLLASFEDPNPVIFFEHKALYRSIEGKVPEEYYTLPIGKATTARSGETISIITYGMGVHWAKATTEEMGIDADIIDLVSLSPIDYAAIDTSVKKTGKVIVLHEDTHTGGIGGDLSGYISEHLFEYLDGPVIRVSSLDMPIPFAKSLEHIFLPLDRLKKALEKLIKY